MAGAAQNKPMAPKVSVRAPAKPISEAERQLALALAKKGLQNTKIAAELGRVPSTVTKILRGMPPSEAFPQDKRPFLFKGQSGEKLFR